MPSPRAIRPTPETVSKGPTMPTTVNGIGTHYYGRKNKVVRQGVCNSCHRTANLESYDTRLWFVVIFIPLIPLGRKRIIDKCPYCTRHVAADADAYEQAKQLQTSGSQEQYRRDPSPEAALGVHAQLLSFHEHEQAAEFRRSALGRFPAHAGLRVGVGSHLNQVSSFDEAAELFEEALKLEPDLPEARAGVAWRMMTLGELDEARSLLDFLEEPGAGQYHNLGPIDRLSTCFQQQGRHEEALEIAGILLREIPEAGQRHAFRGFVRKSEKALGRPDSILPPAGRTILGLFRAEGSPYSSGQRKLALGAVGLALLAAGLLISNEYIRTHRTIHVVNACGVPVQVRVDDGPPQMVLGMGRLVVAEGPHRLSVDGPVPETHDVALRSGYFERWTHKPLWAFNPGGEAVLGDQTVFYALHPQPSPVRYVVGLPFLALPHVDYPFTDPPPRMQVEGKDKVVSKTVVEWLRGHDAAAFQAALATDRAAALGFAERRLRRVGGQPDLMKAYLRSIPPEEAPRVEALLRSGLARRPVDVLWHRNYQGFAGLGGRENRVIDEYDRYLAAEPASGALLYLRGRVETDDARQSDFFRRSIEADPRLPWPWFALGKEAESRADFPEALRCLLRARELRIDDETAAPSLHVARLATGDAPGLVAEYRSRLGAGPPDPMIMVFLGEALAASGQSDRVVPEMVGILVRLPFPMPGDFSDMIRAMGSYLAGKLPEAETLSGQVTSLRTSAFRAQTLAAMGRAGEAASDPTLEPARDDPWCALAIAVGVTLEGKSDQAARWRDRAVARLQGSTSVYREAAGVLASDGPPPVARVVGLKIEPGEKALVFACLAALFPDRKAEYLAEAGKYNIRRSPPYQMVRRAIDGPAPASP